MACFGAVSVLATGSCSSAPTCATENAWWTYAAAHIQHMQKALMQMNVQLHHVVTDITGVTGMRIIRAIVSGAHAPDALAQLRDARGFARNDP